MSNPSPSAHEPAPKCWIQKHGGFKLLSSVEQDNHKVLWDSMRAYRPIMQKSMKVTWPTTLPQPRIRLTHTNENLRGLRHTPLEVSAKDAAVPVPLQVRAANFIIKPIKSGHDTKPSSELQLLYRDSCNALRFLRFCLASSIQEGDVQHLPC